MKMIYRGLGVLIALIGVIFLAQAMTMWVGGVILTPVGFLFGIGEAGNYATMNEKLTNLFWHVVLGIAGFGYSLVFKIVAALLFGGSWLLWRRSNKSTGNPSL
jgi:hypothetical protein